MYVYRITNKINSKKYIGITSDYERRFSQHIKRISNSAIHRAIAKYGAENFLFQVLFHNLSIEESCEKEIGLIKKENTLVPNGYNIDKGGIHPQEGELNGRAKLTMKQVRYIKRHRDLPMYVLYDEFSDLITYSSFKEIYNDKKWKQIKPTVDPYPHNLEFSNQFTSNNKLDYGEVVKLRKLYSEKVPWRKVYEEGYADLYPRELDFWNIYVGNIYKLVMPEVFTAQNKHFQASISHSGENNGRAKLTKEDVLKIRDLYDNQGEKVPELCKLFPQVSKSSIQNVVRRKTWKEL